MKSLKKTFVLFLVITLVISLFPLQEIEAKTPKITVTTDEALYREMKKSTAAVITYKNKKTTKLTISEVGVPSNKTLVLNCKKAEVTNKAKFKTVKIKAAKKYTEKVSGNTIEVLNSKTLLSISKKMKVTKLTVPTKKFMDNVKLGKKAKILNLVYADAKVTTTPEPTNVEPTKTEPTKTPTNVPAPTVTETPTVTVAPTPVVTPTVQPTVTVAPTVQPTITQTPSVDLSCLTTYGKQFITNKNNSGSDIISVSIGDVFIEDELDESIYKIVTTSSAGSTFTYTITYFDDPEFFEPYKPVDTPTPTEEPTPEITTTPELTPVDPATCNHDWKTRSFHGIRHIPAEYKYVQVMKCSSLQNDGTYCDCLFYDIVKNEDGTESVVHWTQEQINAHVIAHMDKGELGNVMTTSTGIISEPGYDITDTLINWDYCELCHSLKEGWDTNENFTITDTTPMSFTQ